MKHLWGTVLPYISIVIMPCDEHGIPAGERNIEAVQFEAKCLVMAWFGFCFTMAFGEISPRKVDPSNPRAFARGDMF